MIVDSSEWLFWCLMNALSWGITAWTKVLLISTRNKTFNRLMMRTRLKSLSVYIGCAVTFWNFFTNYRFLEIYEKDKEWKEGYAKKQLLSIFDHLGSENELSKKGRRALTSLIFVWELYGKFTKKHTPFSFARSSSVAQ